MKSLTPPPRAPWRGFRSEKSPIPVSSKSLCASAFDSGRRVGARFRRGDDPKISTTNHESRITNHESRITNHESRITNHESRITNHESRITNHESRITVIQA